MNRRRQLRPRVAVATAICFGTLAVLACGTPAQPHAGACDRPVWSAAFSWAASDCR